MKIHLLVIDPQNDFMDYPESSLPVPGGVADMQRIAKMVDRIGKRIDDIHVTMDSHRLLDIAHTGMIIDGKITPSWWTNDHGDSPSPYQIISAEDVKSRRWHPRIAGFYKRSLEYVESLAQKGNYLLCAWPPHCLIGTWGHNIQTDLNNSLQKWSAEEFATVNYVTKGSNPWTEHYGGMEAEVPDPSDPSTQLNTEFIQMIQSADIIAIGGEALSHCVKVTVTQIADNIGDEHIKKFHILTDGSTSVGAIPGVDFPVISQQWLKDMESRGMKLTTTIDFLS
jgi:nicotinamidase-related amidase